MTAGIQDAENDRFSSVADRFAGNPPHDPAGEHAVRIDAARSTTHEFDAVG
jgi:hypothetical protein